MPGLRPRRAAGRSISSTWSASAGAERTVPRAASTRDTEDSDGGAVGEQRRGVHRVVAGEDARWRQRTEMLARLGEVAHPLRAWSAWVGLGVSRSRWASTIAPTAAVISSAEVTSKAKT